MIPKVDFQVHEILLRAFFFPREYGGGRDKFDGDVEKFVSLFRQYEDKILELIEKFSGFSWSRDRIPVFLVPASMMVRYSFAKANLENDLPGIVLKIFADPGRELFIFIHELSHINQRQSDFYEKYAFGKNGERNTDLLELCADLITLKILRDLFGNNSEYEKLFWTFLKDPKSDKNKIKYEKILEFESKWDLSKRNIREYIELGQDFP